MTEYPVIGNDVFAERFAERTRTSKVLRQKYGRYLADSRARAGYRPSIAGIIYPIVGSRGAGSRLWDVDGNEYIDIAMGFGVHLFGHNPQFVMEAIAARCGQGFSLGMQSELAGEVAERVCRLTGVERVCFCTTGTEAVMTALRLARASTGRNKIAMFWGSYHGHFDGTLARPQKARGAGCAQPVAPGIPRRLLEDTIVLEYGDPESLSILEQHAHDLAAVIVEPVQGYRPDLQPRDFLLLLRKWTSANRTVLIFDEIMVGFRIHPGGAQAWFGIEADLATYGKIVGGGLPIGIVGGKARYMDAIDGGAAPMGPGPKDGVRTTFFAGTFNKHPVTMVAAASVLQHLESTGPGLQAQATAKTAEFANGLNAHFEAKDIPIRVAWFGSMFRFVVPSSLEIFYYRLVENGVYVWEGRSCFFSTAHTDDDIAWVIEAATRSAAELPAAALLAQQRRGAAQTPRW